jgi:enoyl-CoA hydratase
MMDAEEAERSGLVSRIVDSESLIDEAVKTAEAIAKLSRPIVLMAKEAINSAYETTLVQGINLERRLFYATFSTEDQKEGMAAFSEKRQPAFRNK